MSVLSKFSDHERCSRARATLRGHTDARLTCATPLMAVAFVLVWRLPDVLYGRGHSGADTGRDLSGAAAPGSVEPGVNHGEPSQRRDDEHLRQAGTIAAREPSGPHRRPTQRVTTQATDRPRLPLQGACGSASRGKFWLPHPWPARPASVRLPHGHGRASDPSLILRSLTPPSPLREQSI
jgi:hypothetical protein